MVIDKHPEEVDLKLQKKTMYVWLFLPGHMLRHWDTCSGTWTPVLAKITVLTWFFFCNFTKHLTPTPLLAPPSPPLFLDV